MSSATDPSSAARQVRSWLESLGRRVERQRELAGDVSARRYQRVWFEGGATAVVALYPPAMEGTCRRFLATGSLLDRAGVRVPTVLATDCDLGLMLLEDLGSSSLYDHGARPWAELAPLFARAAEAAARIATLPPAEVQALNPVLGRERLQGELAQTWTLLLEPLALTGTATLSDALRQALEEITERLAAETARPCHRDFMARNLQLVDGEVEQLVVLDHQDLCLGPPCYDLASLLNDSLFPPPAIEADLLHRFLPEAAQATSYRRAAAQRTLKAAGTFAAFARRGFGRHLPLIPATLGAALRHLDRLPESAPLTAHLRTLWRPLLAGDLPLADRLLNCSGTPRRDLVDSDG